MIVDRETGQDEQKIVYLVKKGAPVNSVNARPIVQFLADFEEANLDSLPLKPVPLGRAALEKTSTGTN